MDNMRRIQRLAKLGKILSTVVFVCCVVGIAACVMCTMGLIICSDLIEKALAGNTDISVGHLYAVTAAGMVLATGEALAAKFAMKYFNYELSVGTPFCAECARLMRNVGIATIVVPLASAVAANLVCSAVAYAFGIIMPIDLEYFGSVGTGIGFLIASVLCKAAAEERNSK